MLTQRADDLQGADGVDTTFRAPVTQNETGSGALANTFETGDVLDGGADSRNVLQADLIATGTINNDGVAISAETTNIQEVYFRAQQSLSDLADNTTSAARIDAEKMVGVEQWWTDNSRANVIIEDVRTRPIDSVLGMRNTDPEVDFEVYFNPLFMDGGQSSESQLVIQIAELDGGVVNADAELQNISVSALSFELDGEAVTLSSDAMAAANTWEELEAAIVEALEAEGLGDLQVTRGNNGEFLLFDAEGRPFSNQGGFTASATTDQQIDIRNRITQDVEVTDEQTETTIVLDGVGNGSRGGDLVVGAMSGDRGVEVFNLVVDRDSHLSSARSTNSEFGTSFTTEMNLEEVYVTHFDGGAEGNLQLGRRSVDSNGISSTTDDRLAFGGAAQSGLVDVRVFDASGFSGEIKLAAELTTSVFDKYLADAEEAVQFSYLLGDGGNNLNLRVDNEIASDPDFQLEVIGGASDDRINLTDLAVKNSTEIDGAGGSNTVEINTTTGATAGEDGNYESDATAAEYSAAQTAFGAFENVDTLVIAGSNDTRQHIVNGNLTEIDGGEIVIATTSSIIEDELVGVDTDIVASRIDTALSIDGKNQVLGAGQNNNDQAFGTVQILNTRPEPGTASQSLTLQNAARLNGELSVENLVIGTEGAGATNAISTLDLTSAGRRDTTNLVQNAVLGGVNVLNLDGTQDLAIHVSSMATGNSVVDGSELGGDLDLAMNAALLNGVNDVLTGTDGENDRLYVYGTDASATVSGFETVQLGLGGDAMPAFTGASQPGFGGTFNAAAVSGVEEYVIQTTADDVSVINLGESEVVTIETYANDILLEAADRNTNNEILVNLNPAGTATLDIVDYREVTLDIGNNDATIVDLALFAKDEDGDRDADTYTRTLEITGGGNGEGSVSIDSLDTALTTIDFSGYAGEFLSNGWEATTGSNATILVNGYDLEFSVAAGGAETGFITEFRFTTDANSFGTVWQIDDFQVFGDATLQNRTLINLRDLGLTETDVSWTDGASFWSNLTAEEQALFDVNLINEANNTIVTSNNDGDNFTIVLTEVGVAALNDENFLYAS